MPAPEAVAPPAVAVTEVVTTIPPRIPDIAPQGGPVPSYLITLMPCREPVVPSLLSSQLAIVVAQFSAIATDFAAVVPVIAPAALCEGAE